jgi:hypothetical protein
MSERDDRLWQSGYVKLPGDRGISQAESRVYQRCSGCGGYFRADALKVYTDHHECQPPKAPVTPIAVERRRRPSAAPRLAPSLSSLTSRRRT